MILNVKGIDKFTVDKRIDLKVTEFTFDLLSKYNPVEILHGKKVQFQLKNLYGSYGGGVLFNGRIERIDDAIDENKRTFSVGGRNVAMYLEEQPFYSPCYQVTTGTKRTRNFLWLLNRIVKGTGVKLGPEVANLSQNFSNDPADTNHYCGLFRRRTDAIDWLFTRYGEVKGKPSGWFYWWVDTSGYLRMLDTTNLSNIPTVKIISFPNSGILSIKLGLNIQSLENDVTVVGGTTEAPIRIRKINKDSIKSYGRRPADIITDTSLTTAAQVEARATKELENRSRIVLVGEVQTIGFPMTECGLGFEFYFSERYKGIKFIITSIKHAGSGGKYTTTLGISTDKNVLVNPNLSDVIEQMIKARMPKDQPSEAKVTAVNTETGRIDVVPVQSVGSGGLKAGMKGASNVALANNASMAGGGSLSARVGGFRSGG
ncbi:MAG: hypothetical protein QHH15_00520 [Candidatus Thermoplasmatota archaeon]|nr:hypothetical protein [Candidatus Thermoplasmatota archaeon]MDH7506258.1 hypothetical protein [Candidatus Thermoplasmatota archaeon]